MIGALHPWKRRIFRLRSQFFSPCCVGINNCNVPPFLYRTLFFQNVLCNDVVPNGNRSGVSGHLRIQGASWPAQNQRFRKGVGGRGLATNREQSTAKIGRAKSWAFFSQKFLRFHFLRSVKLGKWVAGTSTPGHTDAKSTLSRR